jgi:hypothetical protein
MNTAASIHDLQSGQLLAQIKLEGSPIPVNELLSANGQLQGFTILSSSGGLREAWYNQRIILLRVGNSQRQIRIKTYPSDGEMQGFLDFIPGTLTNCQQANIKSQTRSRRGLALIQTIFGA